MVCFDCAGALRWVQEVPALKSHTQTTTAVAFWYLLKGMPDFNHMLLSEAKQCPSEKGNSAMWIYLLGDRSREPEFIKVQRPLPAGVAGGRRKCGLTGHCSHSEASPG